MMKEDSTVALIFASCRINTSWMNPSVFVSEDCLGFAGKLDLLYLFEDD